MFLLTSPSTRSVKTALAHFLHTWDVLGQSASDVATLTFLECETCHSFWDYVLFPRPPVQTGFLLQGFQTYPISLANVPFLFSVFLTFLLNVFYALPIIFTLVICMAILFLVLHH